MFDYRGLSDYTPIEDQVPKSLLFGVAFSAPLKARDNPTALGIQNFAAST